jgi:hypothetical protein
MSFSNMMISRTNKTCVVQWLLGKLLFFTTVMSFQDMLVLCLCLIE